MALERGVLKVTQRKSKHPLVQVLVDGNALNVAQGALSYNLTPTDGMEVDFERIQGQPKRIRAVGGDFTEAPITGRVAGSMSPAKPTGGQRHPKAGRQHDGRDRGAQRLNPDFHNPYNFVPAPSRMTDHPSLGDHRPVRQDGFDPHRYTGRIPVRMVAKTPLLVPDTERVEESNIGHKTYPLRVGADDRPLIPASSVRGMLRAAYEAVTNSRFGRLSEEQHRGRLAFRMDARDGVRLIPARIEDGQIRLLPGTSGAGQDSRPVQGDPMYAAWLPRYRNGRVDHTGMRYSDGGLPNHGEEVQCWLERFQHHRWDRNKRAHVADFQYWRVRALAREIESLGQRPEPSAAPVKNDHQSWHQPLGQELKGARGWVCVTNANINRKHDERVFFGDSTSDVPGPFPVTEAHRSIWRELIQNYQSIHEDDLSKRRTRGQQPDQYLSPEPGQTAWSRHVYTAGDRQLVDGTLCHIRLNANRTDAEALFPVMISRELYSASPWDILPKSLRPAANVDQLSPADRVFGWVRVDVESDALARSSRDPVAVRGLLRVGPVTCESKAADATESFPSPGVPLAILSTPKPQQGRFYVATTPNGEAQGDVLNKAQAGYQPDKGLRGRKVYPHQCSLPNAHWRIPTEDRTQSEEGNPAHYQEYRRPKKNGSEQRDDQNRSILGWVKPGAEFTFDLHVHNLSLVELGALMWLLTLPDDHFFRFGGGKPLGFGSVRLTIDECDVCTGNELRARYSTWHAHQHAVDPREPAIQAFKQALLEAYPPTNKGSGFGDMPFIRAFLVACKGFADNLPIHYPRATQDGKPGPPSPDGESFKWFVANEKSDVRYALRSLGDETGLPTLPDGSGGSRSAPRGRAGGMVQ